MLPGNLPPWGDRKVWLTDAGALSAVRDPAESAVVEALRDGGRMTVGDLQSRLGLPDLERVLASLGERGRVASEEKNPKGARYVTAVELSPGEAAQHLKTAGRSAAGKAVVEYLAAVGRPATVGEVVAAADCGPAVVRRLISLGVLRKFSQVEKLSLDHHRMNAGGEAESAIVLRPDQEAAARPHGRGAGGRALRPLPPRRDDRLGEDRGLPAGGRPGAPRRPGLDPPRPRDRPRPRPGADGRAALRAGARDPPLRPRLGRAPPGVGAGAAGGGAGGPRPPLGPLRPLSPRPAARLDRRRRGAGQLLQAGDRAALQRPGSRPRPGEERRGRRRPRLGDPQPGEPAQRGAGQAHPASS